MTSLSRRAFLTVTALATPLAQLRFAAQAVAPSISADEFVRLSARLVGRTTLDREVAAIYLNALLAVPGNVAPLTRLARNAGGAGTTPADTALENTIIEWWYTGIYSLKGEPQIATHTGALMWNSLGMPAPGTCSGPFGAWARPPRARA